MTRSAIRSLPRAVMVRGCTTCRSDLSRQSTSHAASLLVHKHPRIKAAVQQALDMGIVCSAETITELVPCAGMARFGGSGTDTVMRFLRLARCSVGREKLVKFEGQFHGCSDALDYGVMPQPGFLELCRRLCDRRGSVLFFDEVLTTSARGRAVRSRRWA